jgi:hypothetical protein
MSVLASGCIKRLSVGACGLLGLAIVGANLSPVSARTSSLDTVPTYTPAPYFPHAHPPLSRYVSTSGYSYFGDAYFDFVARYWH